MMAATVMCPQKVEYIAALFRMVFERNPGVKMSRREIESVVSVYLPVEGFSESTRQRALWVLANRNVIRWESAWPESGPTIWWLPTTA